MNPAKILIALATIILLSSVLSGCSSENNLHNAASASVQNVEYARQVAKNVNMVLEYEKNDDEITVKVILDNPNKKSITSVQSWLTYNPKALEGIDVIAENSPFEFTAPYENTFDEVKGLVMIGRATANPVEEEKIEIAEVKFKLKTDGVTMIDIFDYQNDLSGHTSCNVMLDGIPYNILVKPESPALIITN